MPDCCHCLHWEYDRALCCHCGEVPENLALTMEGQDRVLKHALERARSIIRITPGQRKHIVRRTMEQDNRG